jgi:glucose/arabinose dehydrogenase
MPVDGVHHSTGDGPSCIRLLMRWTRPHDPFTRAAVFSSLFAGGLSGEPIARLTMDGQKVVIEETLLNRMGRVRDVRQGPDGLIYVAIDGNRRVDKTPIYRLEPAEVH